MYKQGQMHQKIQFMACFTCSVSTSVQAPLAKVREQQQVHKLSRSELMSLAKFRSPQVAEQVLHWLGKGGHLHNTS